MSFAFIYFILSKPVSADLMMSHLILSQISAQIIMSLLRFVSLAILLFGTLAALYLVCERERDRERERERERRNFQKILTLRVPVLLQRAGDDHHEKLSLDLGAGLAPPPSYRHA